MLPAVAPDVTEDKRRVQDVELTVERFRLLVEGAPVYAMFLLDPENSITFWSSWGGESFRLERGRSGSRETRANLIFTSPRTKRTAQSKKRTWDRA